MKFILLVLLLAIISYFYFFITIKKDLYLMDSIQTAIQYTNCLVDNEEYILCVETNMIIDDFYFYKNIIKIFPENKPCKIISFDFSKKDDITFNLIERLEIKNIPSIHYVNREKVSKEVFNFNDLEDSLNAKDVIKMIKGVLYNNESQVNLK